jgi:hypothetical protein
MAGKKKEEVVPIDRVHDSERWIVVPGTIKEGKKKRIKEIRFQRKNCLFAVGVPSSIIDFTYRAVVKLNLREETMIFSRGTVRGARGKTNRAVSVRTLGWDVGRLVTIPRGMRYRDHVTVSLEGEERSLRVMELALLLGLLPLAFPGRENTFYPALAVAILVRGWKVLDDITD